LTWRSLSDRDWLTQKERRIFAAYLVTDWRSIPSVLHAVGFVPDYFIGVTDGCRFGGNKECVNKLVTHGLSKGEASRIPASRYYITDHFENGLVPNTCPPGESVTSLDPNFPYSFKKLALLSGGWGTYGPRTTLGGATLFEVCKSN
jgi:hypothetical protein